MGAQAGVRGLPVQYIIKDFAGLPAGDQYVLVRHYRVEYRAGAGFAEEPVSTRERLIEEMIRAFEGRVLRGQGTVNAYFADDGSARSCAEAIERYHDGHVLVAGQQLTVDL